MPRPYRCHHVVDRTGGALDELAISTPVGAPVEACESFTVTTCLWLEDCEGANSWVFCASALLTGFFRLAHGISSCLTLN